MKTLPGECDGISKKNATDYLICPNRNVLQQTKHLYRQMNHHCKWLRLGQNEQRAVLLQCTC